MVGIVTAALCVGFAAGATATAVGIGIGFDPTGLMIFGAQTEVPLGESLDMRAQVGFATQEIAGLMLASVGIFAHRVFEPIDPYIGIGVGAAITPPPFSTGITLEGTAGVRVIAFEPVCLFLQAHYLLRWSPGGWTSGPIYEGGIQVHF